MPVRVFMGHGGPLPTKAWWDTIIESDPFDALEEWSKCVNAARLEMDKYVSSWRMEMDTLLVFGALYSAIVTAFLVESYKWLRPDSTENVASLLLQVSAQLADARQPVASLPSYAPSKAQISINVLWFASLLLSLTAILLAIMVKQWLSEYTAPSATASPRQSLAIRQARADNMASWHINTIVDWLPLLLIGSLFLFFTGVATLLFTYSILVGIIITVFVSIPILIFLATSILPVLFVTCPYRSIQSYVAGIVLGPVISFFTKRNFLWDIRDTWGSAKRARLEPRALLWILRTICPWNPALYPTVSACTRSLSHLAAPRALCDLYRYSIIDQASRFTKTQARRWQILIGGDEFEMTCSILADGAKSLPSGVEWQEAEDSDIVEYVKTMSLFFTLFSSEYLRAGEIYPADVFRKGVQVMVDIAIGDKLPKRIPSSQLEEVEEFVLQQLKVINNFKWPKSNKVEDPSVLLPALTNAAQSIKTSDIKFSRFISLSTLALGITRRMTNDKFQPNQDHLVSLLSSMSAFIKQRLSQNDQQSIQEAVLQWSSVLYETYSGNASKGRAIKRWDLRNEQSQSAMRSLLELLERAQTNNLLLGSHWRRLYLGFGTVEDMVREYVQSASGKSPWSKDHREHWKLMLSSNEAEHMVTVLGASLKHDNNAGVDSDKLRALCELVPLCRISSSVLVTAVLDLVDIWLNTPVSQGASAPVFPACLIESLHEVLQLFTDNKFRYWSNTDLVQVSLILDRVLSLFVSASGSRLVILLESTLPSTILDISTSGYIDKDFPSIARLQTQAAHFILSLRDFASATDQSSANLIIGWLNSLDVTHPDPQLPRLEETQLFLRAIERNKPLLKAIVKDHRQGTMFRHVCLSFGVDIGKDNIQIV